MKQHPFSILAPYKDTIDIRFFDKSDDITSDDALATALGSDLLATLKQVHGATTVPVMQPQRRTEEADGMITTKPNLWLSIRTADCQPIIFYAPRRAVGGLLHVGWRGLERGAIPRFFDAIQREYGVPSEELLVGVGPSLCKECAEFSDPTTELPSIPSRFIHGRHVDLAGAADQQLRDWGIKNGHIERSTDCTQCLSKEYWSYRAEPDQVKAGHHNVLAMKIGKTS